MKEERKDIVLPLGDTTLNEKLGVYYIDMRPSIVHYTENIYDGAFDDEHVPMCGDGKGGFYYSAVNICQYGFIIHANYLENENQDDLKILINCLNKLESLKLENDEIAKWENNYFNPRYKLNLPWVSAMDCGEVLSFYLRMYQLLKDQNLLTTSYKIFNFLQIDVNDGGVRTRDKNGNLWFEEYPSNPASYVLNGFIYTIFGLFDLYRVTNDPKVKRDIDECIETLKINLHKFDTGYWSKYDLFHKELVRYYYQINVHVPQLMILFELTKEPIFENYGKKWKNNLTFLNYLFVKIMYRIQPRLLKYFNIEV
jgi:heparosan-N-sulfate-glucuronate 5-epimerase